MTPTAGGIRTSALLSLASRRARPPSPWRNVDYFDMTSEVDLDDDVCESRVADRELVAD